MRRAAAHYTAGLSERSRRPFPAFLPPLWRALYVQWLIRRSMPYCHDLDWMAKGGLKLAYVKGEASLRVTAVTGTEVGCSCSNKRVLRRLRTLLPPHDPSLIRLCLNNLRFREPRGRALSEGLDNVSASCRNTFLACVTMHSFAVRSVPLATN
jgi:hypothetical protein